MPREKKIIGLIAARNEENIIATSLRALSHYVDCIVFLDDASEDNTTQIVESLAEQCKVAKIIRKTKWYRDEPGDRNRLLEEGRKLEGTHFVVLDADEVFTSNCLSNNFLRNLIYQLEPGDSLFLVWIVLWKSLYFYRFDNSVWTWNYKPFVFCDDGKCYYASDFIHTKGSCKLKRKSLQVGRL